MTGRLDNARVGYFTNPLLSYSDGQQRVSKQQFITRWRLEPTAASSAFASAATSGSPIVFYIENSTPYRWRKYIKQGIEDWQVAFERAGFKNAIIAKEITDSMTVDMDDVNYSVLTYAASTKANAMGPSILDPRSGEILEADIMWWHNVLNMLQEWITVQTGTVRPEARGIKLSEGRCHAFCSLSRSRSLFRVTPQYDGIMGIPHRFPALQVIHRPDEFDLFFHHGLCPFQLRGTTR